MPIAPATISRLKKYVLWRWGGLVAVMLCSVLLRKVVGHRSHWGISLNMYKTIVLELQRRAHSLSPILMRNRDLAFIAVWPLNCNTGAFRPRRNHLHPCRAQLKLSTIPHGTDSDYRLPLTHQEPSSSCLFNDWQECVQGRIARRVRFRVLGARVLSYWICIVIVFSLLNKTCIIYILHCLVKARLGTLWHLNAWEPCRAKSIRGLCSCFVYSCSLLP